MELLGFPGGSVVESTCQAGDVGSIPGSGRLSGEGNSNPLECSLLGKPHGQRSLAGRCPWGPRRAGRAEQLPSNNKGSWTRSLLTGKDLCVRTKTLCSVYVCIHIFHFRILNLDKMSILYLDLKSYSHSSCLPLSGSPGRGERSWWGVRTVVIRRAPAPCFRTTCWHPVQTVRHALHDTQSGNHIYESSSPWWSDIS